MRTPAQAERGPRGICAVGQQSEVFGDHNLLTQLTVERQLGIVAVALEMENQNPEWEQRGGDRRKGKEEISVKWTKGGGASFKYV